MSILETVDPPAGGNSLIFKMNMLPILEDRLILEVLLLRTEKKQEFSKKH